MKNKNNISEIKIMKKLFFAVLLFCVSITMSAQQEPMYSQYMFNMLNVNPAYAGNRAINNITALHRNQWVNFPGHPMISTLSWDVRAGETNVGYGAQIYSDKLGIENTVGFKGYYSYHIPMGNASLSLGLSLGLLNYNADYTQSNIVDESDPAFMERTNVWLPTAGVGALYSTDSWYVGLSIPALLRTKKYFNDEYRDSVNFGSTNHYFLNGGYILPLSQTVKLKPSVMLKYVIGAPLEADFNLNAWFADRIGVGASYRTGDSVLGMVEIQVTPQIRVGYAYDHTITQLNQFNNGTHEIMLRYEFDLSKDKSKKLLSPRYY